MIFSNRARSWYSSALLSLFIAVMSSELSIECGSEALVVDAVIEACAFVTGDFAHETRLIEASNRASDRIWSLIESYASRLVSLRLYETILSNTVRSVKHC